MSMRQFAVAAALLGIGAFTGSVIWFGLMNPLGKEPTAPARGVASSPPQAGGPSAGTSSAAAPGATAPQAAQTPPVPSPAAPTGAPSSQAALPPAAGPLAGQPEVPASQAAAPLPSPPEAGPRPPGEQPIAAAPSREGALPSPEQSREARAPEARPRPAGPERPAPSFDIVRVEPTGDAVIAGRSVPNAMVELLRNGKPHARAVADAAGLFALVPPPLPPGDHEIVLKAIAPDGERSLSKESVTVTVLPDRTSRPLVALASPDRPTVLLSNPEPPPPPARAEPPPAPQSAGEPARPAPPKAPAPRPEVRIATVEAQGQGRLMVSGLAAPGATVRLYLNDALIAPGGAGSDGRVAFAIERGVRPGDYRVRLDDVDPVSGQVRTRAEVGFTVPQTIAAPEAPDQQAAVQAPKTPGQGAPGQGSPGQGSSSPGPPPSGAPAPGLPAAGSSAQGAPSPGQPGPAPPAEARGPAQQARSAPVPPQPTAAAQPRGEGGRPVEIGLVTVPEVNTAIVARGDNLWSISRRIYGEGVRYTVIYGANQPQIRDPNRIYPGQVFVLPGEGGVKAN